MRSSTRIRSHLPMRSLEADSLALTDALSLRRLLALTEALVDADVLAETDALVEADSLALQTHSLTRLTGTY